MATSQSTTTKPTAFPEDIKVGQDVLNLRALSSGILGMGRSRRNRGLGLMVKLLPWTPLAWVRESRARAKASHGGAWFCQGQSLLYDAR